MALPRDKRIKKKNDFDLIFKKGRSFKTGLFILRSLKNNQNKNRFAFITSQKVSKKAVIRNKIRRRMSEAAADFEKNLGQEIAGTDFVFFCLAGIDKKNFQEIKDLVKTTLIKCSAH